MPALAATLTQIMVRRGDARLQVLTQGKGPAIVLLPSLGRGASDFDAIAEKLAGAGYRVLRPQPRGIGDSTGPWDGVKLEDLAADIAAVIESEQSGPAFVVGHAFGNRVARTLATVRPEVVRAVGLVAANVGRNPSPPDVRAAIRLSADLNAPDDERIKAMQFVFFAPGQRRPRLAQGLAPGRAGRAAYCRRSHAARRWTTPPASRRCSTSSRATIRSPTSKMRKPTRRRSATASPSWSFQIQRMP